MDSGRLAISRRLAFNFGTNSTVQPMAQSMLLPGFYFIRTTRSAGGIRSCSGPFGTKVDALPSMLHCP